jgi:hypothetical protein
MGSAYRALIGNFSGRDRVGVVDPYGKIISKGFLRYRRLAVRSAGSGGS